MHSRIRRAPGLWARLGRWASKFLADRLQFATRRLAELALIDFLKSIAEPTMQFLHGSRRQ
jgi:hypothetical protein